MRSARSYLARIDRFSARRDAHGDLFAAGDTETEAESKDSALREKLAALDLDTLSPREAQQLLYELKRLLEQEPPR